jgi:hypothetical protein
MKLTATTLMKAMGSKKGQWRPEAQSIMEARKNRSVSVLERTVAWAEIGCTRPGQFSPFVLTADFRPATAKDLQRDQGWKTVQAAHRAIRDAIDAGYFIEKPKTACGNAKKDMPIFLCANVVTTRVSVLKEASTSSLITPFIRPFYSKAELKELDAFEPAQKQAAEAVAAAWPTWRRDALNAGTLALRQAIDEAEYNAKRTVGVNAKPKRTKVLKVLVKVDLPLFLPHFEGTPEVTSTGPKLEPVLAPVSLLSLDNYLDKSLYGPPSASADAEGVQPVCIPGLVETPDALDSISKREIRTGQTGPHVSFENKAQERADTEAIERVSSFDLNGGETQFPERSARPPQNKAVKRTTEATIVRDSAASEKTQCQTKKRKHA